MAFKKYSQFLEVDRVACGSKYRQCPQNFLNKQKVKWLLLRQFVSVKPFK